MSKSQNTDPLELPISARRTESLDAPEILKLVIKDTYNLFGRVNVAHIIENANLAVTLVDESNVVIGHAAFFDQPNWSVSPSTHWMHWLQNNFELKDCDPINTLFLHYFVSKEEFSEGILMEIIRTVFHAVPLLHFVVLLAPVDVEIGESLSNIFSSVSRTSDYNSDYQVLICHRHDHCPVLHIREARIEDHDDLMPIFNKHNDHLTEIYGEFFLAELMEAQNESNKCLVADVNGLAVGLMSISKNINTRILKTNFELDVFNNFIVKVEKTKKVIVPKSPTPTLSAVATPTEPEGERSSSPSRSLKASAAGRRKGSPAKSKSKLSTAHMQESAPASPDKTNDMQVEYVTEEFDVESVFCIQLFCIDEKYEARSIDFLPAIFDLFKDKEFVAITVPHTVPEFPLLQAFQRVSPKPTSILSQELYIFNRNGLLRSFNVRCCKSNDFDNIVQLTKTITGHQNIIRDVKQFNDYRRDEDGVRIHAYVAEVHGQVVGLCIFRHEKDIEYIRAHYNIEDFVYFGLHESSEHAHLHHFVLNPIFQHYAKYFIKEIFYLSKTSCLYYPIYPNLVEKNVKPHSLITCLNSLVPVSMRRQITYPLDKLEGNAPKEEIVQKMDPYALYHINRKLTLEPKVVINVRVVVVGASDTGLSALQTLAYCPHLCFNNLTLVSDTDVFDCNENHEELKNGFLPNSIAYNANQQALLSFPTWVNLVRGKITKIDRKNKYLTVNGNQKIPYDQLLLCTGEQHQYTVPTGADISQLVTTSEALAATDTSNMCKAFVPEKVFVVNGISDCLKIKHWLQDSFKAEKIIVYGGSIEAYTCINGLLKHGVDGSCISHVRPPAAPPSCFNIPHVDDVMDKELESVGVATYGGYTLARWNNGAEDTALQLATFTSDTKPLSLECQAFFCCEKKTIDFAAFKAINDSCLVFDGKLVIDSKFQTNDECIRAGGPLTKYARRYHSENWTHANFNSREVGAKLAESLLELFDPTLDTFNVDDGGLVPKYHEAKKIYCQLPGGFFYFHCWKPCITTQMETQMSQPDYGEDLVTGNALKKDAPEYFRVHLDRYNTVQEIACLSKQPISYGNFTCLHGMHQRYLNNLVQRYREGLIKDFYSYFSESWCLAIYHDRFRDFRNEIREIFATLQVGDEDSLEERIRKMVREDTTLGSEQKSHLMDIFIGSDCKKTIEERLNCFLDYNKYHLPMYARPGMV